MTVQPEYIQNQIDQRARDRTHAIQLAIETLEDAKANFKTTVEEINRCYDGIARPKPVTIHGSDINQITADPTVAQYA